MCEFRAANKTEGPSDSSASSSMDVWVAAGSTSSKSSKENSACDRLSDGVMAFANGGDDGGLSNLDKIERSSRMD